MIKKYKIGLIGFGCMGQALVQGLLSSGNVGPNEIIVAGRGDALGSAKKMNVEIGSTEDCCSESELLILSVRPQQFEDIHEVLKHFDGTTVLSVMAGIDDRRLATTLTADTQIIRVMPTLTVSSGKGICVWFSKRRDVSENVRLLLRSWGANIRSEKESLVDDSAAVCACAVGYYFYFLQLLFNQAKAMGFNELDARLLVGEGFASTARLISEGAPEFSDAVREVATPGGMTEAGLAVFRKLKFEEMIGDVVTAVVKRGWELSTANLF